MNDLDVKECIFELYLIGIVFKNTYEIVTHNCTKYVIKGILIKIVSNFCCFTDDRTKPKMLKSKL